MFEKVNPSHPDKVADRIAGAIVDLAYTKADNPKIAVEVLIGHGNCHIITESTVTFTSAEVKQIVDRISQDKVKTNLIQCRQDEHLTKNQDNEIKCGDNGIFKGVPVTEEEKTLANMVKILYEVHPTDGKYILDGNRFIICQSNADSNKLKNTFQNAEVNPLGDWTGGTSVDTGATNRKLGSDMGGSVTGGGLHGKDLSKADVSVNIYAFIEAQRTGKVQEFSCAIGDTKVNGKPYSEIVGVARKYINDIGGFEKFAEYGLI